VSDISHGGHGIAADRRALVISGWLTGIYFLIELVVGLWSGSVAVISDAFHTFSAVGGVLIALVSQRISARPATAAHTFGWGRAEILGALFNGLFLAIMAVTVIWMGAMRLGDPIELPTTVMIWVALGGMVTEVIAFWLLYKRQKTNLNIKGAFWHILQTFIGSFIIIISALIIRFTGFLAIDALLGMAFGVVLLWASWSILRSALRILLQGAPHDLELDNVTTALAAIDGVHDVHHVHAWTITSGQIVFSAHLHVPDPHKDGGRVLRTAAQLLREKFGVYFSTLQIEDQCQAQEPTALDITDQIGRNPADSGQ
jgi:cobalt-zinc-cadmium efflux system protein